MYIFFKFSVVRAISIAKASLISFTLPLFYRFNNLNFLLEYQCVRAPSRAVLQPVVPRKESSVRSVRPIGLLTVDLPTYIMDPLTFVSCRDRRAQVDRKQSNVNKKNAFLSFKKSSENLPNGQPQM